MRILLTLFFSSLSTLAIVHYVALNFFLYWKYYWFDIPVHMLGGICVGLGISILPFIRIRLPQFFNTYLGYICIVLVIGTIWEIFEYGVGISFISDPEFIPDTLIDYVMDVVGVLIGYYVVKSLDNLNN